MLQEYGITEIDKNKLKNYMKNKYGFHSIKESEDNRDKDSDCLINKKLLYDITYKKFFDINSNYKDYITFNQLLNFLLTKDGANSSATCGKYHEFMDMIHILCNISIDQNDLPKYDKINFMLKQIIKPDREEYEICWWIINKVSNDNFIKKFLFLDSEKKEKYAFPSFQHEYNNRFYDVCFDKLGLIIEIQENNSAHKHNPNDELKELIIKMMGKRIKYFKLCEYKKRHIDYLNDFWHNTLKKAIIEALLYDKVEARKAYCFDRFIEICKEEYEEIKKEIIHLHSCEKNVKNVKSERYENLCEKLINLDKFIKLPNQSLLCELFNYRDKAEETKNDYIIKVSDIKEIFGFDFSTINKLYDIIYNSGFKMKQLDFDDQREMCIPWHTLVKLVRMKKLNRPENDINEIDDYLQNIESIYEEIIRKIKSHTDEIINNINNNIKNYKKYDEHIIKKEQDNLNKKISNLSDKIEKFEFETKYFCNISKQLIKITKKQNDICTDIFTKKKDKELINKNKNLSDELEQYYNINIGNNITIQKEINKSIILEMPYFPIIFTNNPNDKMNMCNFIGLCNAYNINATNQKKIKEKLYEGFNLIPNNILHYIKDITFQQEDNISNNCSNTNLINKILNQRINQKNILLLKSVDMDNLNFNNDTLDFEFDLDVNNNSSNTTNEEINLSDDYEFD
jgi:hypothetical protein